MEIRPFIGVYSIDFFVGRQEQDMAAKKRPALSAGLSKKKVLSDGYIFFITASLTPVHHFVSSAICGSIRARPNRLPNCPR
jgi:hypothetical protein